MSKLSKHVLLGVGLAALLFETAARPALSVDKVSLFKVTTPRGDIVIGLSHDDLRRLDEDGPRKSKVQNAAIVSKAIADHGELKVWQYSERKTGDDDIIYVPVKYFGLQWRDAMRVENFPTRQKVVAIDEYTMRQ